MKKNNIERRADAKGMQAEKEGRKITGYAALYNQRSEDLGGFIEVIEPGAFDEAITKSDVRALINHNDNLVLARTASGTLKLEVDEKGLRYEFEVPNTTYGNDLLENVRAGNISQSSFAFSMGSGKDYENWDEMDDGRLLRTIKRVDELFDVSPVTYPAYKSTTVSARSLDQVEQLKHKEEEKGDEQRERARLNIYDKILELKSKKR
jgi:HK97 family phage prohead protease